MDLGMDVVRADATIRTELTAAAYSISRGVRAVAWLEFGAGSGQDEKSVRRMIREEVSDRRRWAWGSVQPRVAVYRSGGGERRWLGVLLYADQEMRLAWEAANRLRSREARLALRGLLLGYAPPLVAQFIRSARRDSRAQRVAARRAQTRGGG